MLFQLDFKPAPLVWYGKPVEESLAGEITGLSREATVVFLDGYVVTIKLPSKYLCLYLWVNITVYSGKRSFTSQ